MKRRFLLVCLLILALLFALIIISIVNAPQHSEDLALNTALSDPGVKAAIANDQGNYKVLSIIPQGQTEQSGYINVNNTLYIVNLSMQGMMFGPDREIAFVDMNQSKVIGSEWYSYRGFPGSFGITLPPGASYYHILIGSIIGGPGMMDQFGVQTFWGRIDSLTPKDAKVIPILVDAANLSLMKNGSSYQPAEYNDTNTNRTTVMNGTYTIYLGWDVNASIRRQPAYNTGNWPDFDLSKKYYLVLKNIGTDQVDLDLGLY